MKRLDFKISPGIVLFFTAMLCLIGCKKDTVSENDTRIHSSKNKAVIAACTSCWVSVGNRNNDTYECYDPIVSDWNTSAALKMTFKPTAARGYTSSEIAAWSNPLDLKLREVAMWGTSGNPTGKVIATVSSTGLATIAEYWTGNKKWARNVTATAYPHAAEVLPNGNIAIAATHSGAGGWVRVYASSQGPSNNTYAQYNLDWAHGVLWDPGLNRLWVCGGPSGVNYLTALIVGGTAAAPTLTEDLSRRSPTPSGGFHDLSPYHGDTNQLLLTTTTGVYRYNKSTKAFTALPGAVQTANVKGMSNMPSTGEIFTTLGWTNTVKFYNGTTGAFLYNRSRTSASWYKCRTFNTAYQ